MRRRQGAGAVGGAWRCASLRSPLPIWRCQQLQCAIRCPHPAGDGAGILAAIPDTFFGTIMEAQGVRLPPAGDYAVGQVFLPQVRRGPGGGGVVAIAPRCSRGGGYPADPLWPLGRPPCCLIATGF